MIFEVDKDVCVSPHRHGFTEQTPAWKFPVVGRATRPPFFRMRTDRYFIGTDKDEMETFLQSLYVDFTLPAPRPSTDDWNDWMDAVNAVTTDIADFPLRRTPFTV